MKHPDRRQFLKGMAIAGATMGFPCLLSGEEKGTAWQPKLALSSVMFSALKLEDFCKLAAKLGFRGIDLWAPFGHCRHLEEARQLGAEEFLKLLDKNRLEIGAWTTYRTKVDQRGFPAFAEFIGACGGRVVVRESKYIRVGKDQLEEAMRAFFEELQPEIDLAQKFKVKMAIENHGDALLDTIESMEMFMKLNPAPDVVGIALAPYHVQAVKASVTDAIRICGTQLLFFYAWQLAAGIKQLPGHGPIDFSTWMQALEQQQYRQWIAPFMHGELPVGEMTAAVEKSARTLRGNH
jgi:sugar phosphate isomerase/epimerase